MQAGAPPPVAAGDDAEEGEIQGTSPSGLDAPRVAPLVTAPGGAAFPRAPYYFSANAPAAGAAAASGKRKGGSPALEVRWTPGAAPLRAADVQNLVLWLLGRDGAASGPRWCTLRNRQAVSRVVLLEAHGLDAALWAGCAAAAAPALRRLQALPFQARSPTLVPSQTTHSLLTLPPPRKRPRESGEGAAAVAVTEPAAAVLSPGAPNAKRQRLDSGAAAPAGAPAPAAAPSPVVVVAAAAAAALPPPPESYAMSRAEMAAHDYPLHVESTGGAGGAPPEGFLSTRPCAAPGGPAHALVALDCEMVQTAAGPALARATLLARDGAVLLDILVAPEAEVTDYCTRWSGVTAETLVGVTARLADAQAAFLALVAAETLVVVHGGENDFKALCVAHARVVDTVALFPHPKGPPARPALRVLAMRFLRRPIQRGGAGHDSVEDARAALDLALLKFERGPDFGRGGAERGEKLAAALSAAGRRGALVAEMEVVNRYVGGAFDGVPAEGDAEAARHLAREAARPTAALVWGRLTALDALHAARVEALAAAAEAPFAEAAYAGAEWAARVGAAVGALDAAVGAAWDAAPAGTLVLVVTGQGDTAYYRHLEERRHARSGGAGGGVAVPAPAAAEDGGDAKPAAPPSPWGLADEAAMRVVADRAMSALCFVGLKP
jgi:RNA exonuclease 1